jgi:hypothetical protein
VKIQPSKNSNLSRANRRGGFAGFTIGEIAAAVGIAAGLTGIGGEVYSLVDKPSAAGASAGASAAQSKVIANLQAEISQDAAQEQTLEAQLAQEKQAQTYVLLGAGAVVLFVFLRKK